MSAYGPTWEEAQRTFQVIGEAVVADSFENSLQVPGSSLSQAFDSATQRFVGHTQDFQRFMESVQRENPQFLVASPSAQKSGGCYVATAVYGSYDAPEVIVLRRFRDESLAPHAWGRHVIRAYYAISPPFARRLERASVFNLLVRRALDVVVHRLESKSTSR